MTSDALALVALVIALGLMVAEFFVPSGGLIGLFSVVSLIVSVWAAETAWHHSHPGLWYGYLASLFVIIPGGIYGLFQYLKNSEYGDNFFLRAPDPAAVTPYLEEERHLEELVGSVGVAVSDMNPSGIAVVDGERLDCLSEGPLIERGAAVKVIGHRGIYPIVREVPVSELDRPSDLEEVDRPGPDDALEAEGDGTADPFSFEDDLK